MAHFSEKPGPTTYGHPMVASGILRFLSHVMKVNARNRVLGIYPAPVCIWGGHGVGKTQLVEAFARQNQMAFAYLAPAQFEEMGDLIGLPAIEEGRTVFRPPVWAPTWEGPGILLLDDINRADDRIIRGLMPLLQYYGLPGWQLPADWQIVLTANPDTGDYAVTPLDPAFLTRTLHVTMVFSAEEWAFWAQEEGIPEIGIQFVLAYPDLVTGERTTARSLAQFFRNVASLENPLSDLSLLYALGAASLDALTATAFIQFLEHGGDKLPTPERILQATDFAGEVQRPLYQLSRGKGEVMAAVARRLLIYLRRHPEMGGALFQRNLKFFLQLDFLAKDTRFSTMRDLAALDHAGVRDVLQDPEIGSLIL